MQPVYRGFDRATLDRQYSPSSCVADMSVFLEEYARRSEAARRRLRVRRDLRYGPGPAERLDFFPVARPGAPLHVFVHGGYWQQLSKDESAFPALDLVPAQAAFAALGYGLAPRHSLDEIVAMVRRALWWLVEHAGSLGCDPTRVHLSGSSAGAHLVAMALVGDWTPDGRPPAEMFAGATLLSGVYDLEPIRHSYVNDVLGLDRSAALRNSPIRQLPARLPRLVLARGGNETDEFARQHDEFVAAALATGADVLDLVLPDRNHFDVVFDLAAAGTELGGAVRAEMRLAPVIPS
jgi:arylformamidase